jgi:hypothetical protein
LCQGTFMPGGHYYATVDSRGEIGVSIGSIGGHKYGTAYPREVLVVDNKG